MELGQLRDGHRQKVQLSTSWIFEMVPYGRAEEEEGEHFWWKLLCQDDLNGRGQHHSGQWFRCYSVTP